MSSHFNHSTSAQEVADTFADEIKGKNIIITGTSVSGLGAECARVLAKYANLIVITGYNEERLQLTYDAIKADAPTANIRKLVLDLSSLEATRKAAAEVNAYTEPTHVLINNAAAIVTPGYVPTRDGFESQLQIDHLAPTLFTILILPRILAARTPEYTPRIVFVSSSVHVSGPFRFEDPNFQDGAAYDKWAAYAQGKTANILMGVGLSNRLREKGVAAYSVHPGVVWTNMALAIPKDDFIAMGLFDADGNVAEKHKTQFKDLGQGAATHITAAFDPSLKDKAGAYLADCQVVTDAGLAPHASDPALALRLWGVTEKLLGHGLNI